MTLIEEADFRRDDRPRHAREQQGLRALHAQLAQVLVGRKPELLAKHGREARYAQRREIRELRKTHRLVEIGFDINERVDQIGLAHGEVSEVIDSACVDEAR